MMAQKPYTASMRATSARSLDETAPDFADDSSNNSVLLVARCLIAGLFLWSGIGQIQGYDETAAFMIHNGVMATLLPVAVFIELAGGILLIYSFLTIVGTLLSDVLLALADPRIRVEK